MTGKEERGQPAQSWHLDKRVPIAILTGLVMQAGAVFYWGGSFQAQTEERLEQIERRMNGFATRSEGMQREVQDNGRTIAVLLSRIDDTNRNLDRLRGEVATTNELLRQLVARSVE